MLEVLELRNLIEGLPLLLKPRTIQNKSIISDNGP